MNPYASEYRLTGLDCAGLNDTAFTVGYGCVAGGHVLRFDAYDAAYRALHVCGGEIGKCGAGTELFLWTATEDDADLPRRLKIVKVKQETNEIILNNDLDLKQEILDQIADWIGSVYDVKRMTPAFASGEYCFAPGEYAFASGSLCVASGVGAHAEGILCQARGDMSFAIGNMTIASGAGSFASGSNTVATGMFSHAEGSSTKAGGDNSHAGGLGTEASGDASRAEGFQTKARGRLSVAGGTLSEANADYSRADGYRVTVNAKGAHVIGRDGTLDDAAENEQAFGVAGGDKDHKVIGFIHRSRKAVLNPLYNPSKDTGNTGKDSDGEKQYLPEIAYSTRYRGCLIADKLEIEVSGSASAVLDADQYSRWTLTGAGTAVLQLANWGDGCRGELVIDTRKITPVIPSVWQTSSGDITSVPGVYILEIEQALDTIFYRRKY